MSKGDSEKKKAPNKRLLALSIGFSTVIIFGFMAYKMFSPNQETKFSLKAAIVDQLSEHFPNATFVTRAANLLTDAGFSVSYFSSESVNVTFYKQLIEGNYGIIILRTHSAMRVDQPIVDLFTSEEYSKDAYPAYSGLLSRAEYFVPLGQSTNKSYFAITPNFIERFGSFPKSIIIAMGCSSLNVTGMAQAFINKGAKAYVGWTNAVLANDTDQETARFLNLFLGENRTLSISLGITGWHNYYDKQKGIGVISKMEFYPDSSYVGDLTISSLAAEAKDSKTLFSSLEQFSFLITKVVVNQEKSEIGK